MLDDITGRLLLVVLLLAAASVWSVLRRRRDGRFTPVPAPVTGRPRTAGVLAGHDLGERLGERATFVQFSTATCATCPQVRRVLATLAGHVTGVRHVEVAAEERLDLVRRFGVRRTPTVLLLGPHGEVWSRTSGPMDAARAAAALADHAGIEVTRA